MKNRNFMKLLTGVVLTSVMASAMAAGNNEGKTRCPVGKIAKYENGLWQCVDLTIQSKPGARLSTQASKTVGKTPLTFNKVQVQKPDLVILNITKVGGTDNKFGVQIKNIGKVTSNGGTVYAVNQGGGGVGASSMPYFKPNDTKHVFVTMEAFDFNRGDRIKFMVDSNNEIDESNEKNNTQYLSF